MTKRTYVRIVSYIGFILALVIAAMIISTSSLKTYKGELEVSYRQSLSELNECLNKIDTDITKSLYSNSYGEIYDLSRDLYALCGTAKNAMSRLPVSQLELNNAYKFLSQCSDYAQYIGKKAEKGEEITDEEHNNLKALLTYAQKFCNSTDEMVATMNAGAKITENQVKSGGEINVFALSNSFSREAKTFDDFPTLLYDGPFSDQVLNRNSKLVSESEVYTKEECREIAAKAIDANINAVSYETDDKSKIPCFTFKCGRYTIMVTKQGGYIKEIVYSGLINSSNISQDNACNLASSALKELGYGDMEVCYYETNNNICTVNCAYRKDGVRYYGDLIKVGISMADGEVVSLDAATYLTNHYGREKQEVTLSESDAKAKVSKYLTVESARLCTIPKESGNEVQCYEFTCKSKDTGENALVYINTQSGFEEDIMIMLQSDNGTMVK